MEHSASLGPYILGFCLENIITPPCRERHASAALTCFSRSTPALLFSLPCSPDCLPSALCLPTPFSLFFDSSETPHPACFPNLASAQTGLASFPSRGHNALCLLLSLKWHAHSAVSSLRANDRGLNSLTHSLTHVLTLLLYIMTRTLWALSNILVKG